MSREGIDFTASQDQALSAAAEALAERPRRFIFIYEPRDRDDGDIGITMFSPPDFAFNAVHLLAHALKETEPTVEPPPED